ncbi:leader peptidase (prepilin peptidase) / N-methyltransferase [Methylobacillus rhizosphaerae]|uniref:Prepilin leader peptidase/N-methyltransferase n=1 Tax=Methylobacillus rhizosphaerae TaxID=551994 RepID=A0A238XZX6_9PROT|nr:A24 family peptidase [Methylobacillus rhizosphaerae]SNR64606.1 leader peptidase (prepilin peptidase) / N-methyltransferase [Methylobacillus rhizosphaerae]
MPDSVSIFLTSLQDTPTFLIVLSVLLGVVVGSFLNVVIHRLPRMMQLSWQQEHLAAMNQPAQEYPRYNLAHPRSHCPRCKHTLSTLENIPLLSYLALGGKCRTCKASISLRYPVVEILSGLLAGMVSVHFGYSALTVAAWILVFALLALTFIDLDTFLLPDSITLPLLWLGLLLSLSGHGFTDISSAVLGATLGYLSLWSVYWLFKLATGKEGMGYGDFKLLAALGAWFGWQLLPAIILISAAIGSIIGLTLLMFANYDRETPIPFGPYLALAGLIVMFFGKHLS